QQAGEAAEVRSAQRGPYLLPELLQRQGLRGHAIPPVRRRPSVARPVLPALPAAARRSLPGARDPGTSVHVGGGRPCSDREDGPARGRGERGGAGVTTVVPCPACWRWCSPAAKGSG